MSVQVLTREAVLARARELGWPSCYVAGVELADMDSWITRSQVFAERDLDAAHSQLDAVAAELERQREADAHRLLDPDDPEDHEAQAAAQLVADAARAAAERALPMTREQADKMIRVLEDIRDGRRR